MLETLANTLCPLTNKWVQLFHADLAQRHFPACPLYSECQNENRLLLLPPDSAAVVFQLFVWLNDGEQLQFVLQVGTNNFTPKKQE